MKKHNPIKMAEKLEKKFRKNYPDMDVRVGLRAWEQAIYVLVHDVSDVGSFPVYEAEYGYDGILKSSSSH